MPRILEALPAGRSADRHSRRRPRRDPLHRPQRSSRSRFRSRRCRTCARSIDGRVDVGTDPQPGGRRPAGAGAGRARPPAAPAADRRPAGDGDRRRRLDRLRAVPADRRPEAGGAGDVRSVREQPPRHPRWSSTIASRAFGVIPIIGDVTDAARVNAVLARAPAGDHLPRGGAQARAADGGEPVRGGQEQRRAARGCSPRRPTRTASIASS